MSRKGENIRKRKDGRWEGRYKQGKNPDGILRYPLRLPRVCWSISVVQYFLRCLKQLNGSRDSRVNCLESPINVPLTRIAENFV